jgi:putative ABC transport system permease protein
MVGFLIFWILSIKGRQLQFGILRSIGLSKTKVIGMLVWDQLLISGAAIGIGVVIGKLVAALYVPVLQITSSASEQLPPFLISIFPSDYAKIFAVVAFIVVSGLLVLTTIVSRLNINQTLKMGED